MPNVPVSASTAPAPTLAVRSAAGLGACIALMSGCINEERVSHIDQDAIDTSGIDLVEPDAADGSDGSDDSDGGETQGSASGEACESDTECASGHCLLGRAGRTCAYDCAETACPGELTCRDVAGDRVCVDRFVALCMPCREHDDCDLGATAGLAGRSPNRCLAGDDATAGTGRFCGVACGQDLGECAAGSECVEGQCRPSTGVCLCSAAAVALGAETSCSVQAGGDALCVGTRRCETVAEDASACDAPAPSDERCDGLDDDCDGATDERPLTPDCGGFVCLGSAGCGEACVTQADCAPGLGCDVDDRDGDLRTDECIATGEQGTTCELPSECDSGACSNGYCCPSASPDGSERLCCAEDADCTGLDGDAQCGEADLAGCLGTKTVGRCEASLCVGVRVPSPEGCVGHTCRGAQCQPGGVLDGAHLCDASGTCVETADQVCDDGDPCTFDACNATVGCETSPRSGASQVACYTLDPATRGVGACRDGVVTCQNGVENGCSDERGPTTEACNGSDDDCDSLTDEDTEIACFPYLCGGEAGCLAKCDASSDCAAGNFCDNAGRCAGTGDNGAICADDNACKSGHCGGGVCCEAGLCCRSNLDCAPLDDAICDVSGAAGCAGTRVRGVCEAGAVCGTETHADASACSGEVCAASSCDGDILVPAALCDGSLCTRAASTSCSPFACDGGECVARCGSDVDCSNGAQCRDGACRDLPAGEACSKPEQCAGGYCANGFCCSGPGLCCGGDDAACASLDGASTCTDAGTCKGTRIAGECGAEFRCAAVSVPSADACLGETCGGSECVNLEGGSLTLEGLRTRQCDTTGTCIAAVHDCRNAEDGACTTNSSVFLTCDNCAPDRTTCVVYASPCYCE